MQKNIREKMKLAVKSLIMVVFLLAAFSPLTLSLKNEFEVSLDVKFALAANCEEKFTGITLEKAVVREDYTGPTLCVVKETGRVFVYNKDDLLVDKEYPTLLLSQSLGREPGQDWKGTKIPGVTSCDKFSDWIGFTCFFRLASVGIGTLLITVTGWLLAASALLFNVLVDHTIVSFGYLFDASVKDAINVGWGALRDIANIIIIGMFVFISVNIILGVKDFGDKKRVAHVLIVAVLINFSLLFTKVIVDASNFTAYQFYKASGLTSDVQSAQSTKGIVENEFVKEGIAGEFIKLMGLTSVGQTYAALTKAAFGDKSVNFTNANGWYALLHGLVTATLFFFTACVLLYGSYLLISRAVLIILLMITAAPAFATWLIPQKYVEGGFAKWWESLLKAAFFAPILMALLWVTLTVARSIPKGKGTLGGFITNPTSTLDLNSIFYYAIVMGLLLASLMVANMFSKTIPGFARTSSALGWLGGAAAVGSVGLASRFGVAPLWRRFPGRYYARRAMEIGDELDERKLNTPKDSKGLAKLARAKERRNWLAGADMNVMKTGPMQTLAKQVGLGILAGGHEGGAAKIIKDRADLAAKHAAEMALSADDRNKIKTAAAEKAADERSKARDTHEEEVKEARSRAAKEKGNVDSKKSAEAEKKLEEAKANRSAKSKDHDGKVSALEKELAEERDAARSAVLRNRLEGMRGQRDSELRAEDENIKKAQEEVVRIQNPESLKLAEAALKAATEKLQKFDAESDRVVSERAKDIEVEVHADINEGIQGAGYRLARTMPVTLQGRRVKGGDVISESARRATKKKLGLRRIATARVAERELLGGEAEEGGAPAGGTAPRT